MNIHSRYMEVIFYGCKSRTKRGKDDTRENQDTKEFNKEKTKPFEVNVWWEIMLDEWADLSILGLIECFTEAAPQLILQLFLMCRLGPKDGMLTCMYHITIPFYLGG